MKYFTTIVIFLSFSLGCREPFEPEVSGIDHGFLVVEGYIEVGGGETSIKLSRTRPLYDPLAILPVESASVHIEGEDGGSWPLQHQGNGVYSSSDYLPEIRNFILKIHTQENQAYTSQIIKPIVTPEIAEIDFEKNEWNVHISASTFGHQEARYFIWEYKETWAFTARHLSTARYNPNTNSMELLKKEEERYKCWQEDNSKQIILASSRGYENDYIHQKELVKIDSLSEKLGDRYSIWVKQTAIDPEAFMFWEAVRKNSSDIGGIFSPLPSHIKSNVYNLDHPEEPVIGFISAGKTSENRIFINRADVDP